MTALKKMAALFAITVFAVLSVSACNLFMSDEEVINNMITAMAEVESYSNDTTVEGALAVDGVPGVNFQLLMSGDAYMPKVVEGEELEAAFNYNIAGDIDAQGQVMSFEADMKMLDGAMYFKLNALPMIPMMDLSDLTGQWVAFDFSALDEFNAAKTGTVSQANFADLMTYANELYSEANIFTLKEDLGTEKVDGHRVYHFSVEMNKEALAEMMMDLVMKMVDGEEIEESEIEATKEEMLVAFETLNFKNLELFIDKTDFYLRRMVMDMEIAAPEGEEGTVNIKIDGIYDAFNEAVTVTAPEDAISLEELMTAVMGPMPTELNNSELDNEFDAADMKELQAELSPEEAAMLEELLQENPGVIGQ